MSSSRPAEEVSPSLKVKLPQSVEVGSVSSKPCASTCTRFKFLEIFTGAGGLSTATQEVCSQDVSVIRFVDLDVSLDKDFTKLIDTKTDWLHAAPPCKTFLAARRTDMHSSAKILRSADRPEGFG